AVAQLVERNLAKVEVESSRLFCRSRMQWGKRVIVFPVFVRPSLTALNPLGKTPPRFICLSRFCKNPVTGFAYYRHHGRSLARGWRNLVGDEDEAFPDGRCAALGAVDLRPGCGALSS
ncbi:hypothetical protein, partial [Zoogloea sp. LCSB751]|uniref:hypothetical protein n=1 Tax=Zoogloea sp. LCSB751 TaxID=1965277 RepID=UPI001C1FD602